jgi:hypothetical protein
VVFLASGSAGKSPQRGFVKWEDHRNAGGFREASWISAAKHIYKNTLAK